MLKCSISNHFLIITCLNWSKCWKKETYFLRTKIYRHCGMFTRWCCIFWRSKKIQFGRRWVIKTCNNYVYCQVTLRFPTYMIHFFIIPSLLSLRKSNRPNVPLLHLRLLSICTIIVSYLCAFNLTGCTIAWQL